MALFAVEVRTHRTPTSPERRARQLPGRLARTCGLGILLASVVACSTTPASLPGDPSQSDVATSQQLPAPGCPAAPGLPSGSIATVAGSGLASSSLGRGDGSAATDVGLSPWDLVVERSGSLIFSDYSNNLIRRVDGLGVITPVAGTGDEGFSGDGGPATEAQLSRPGGLAVDASGAIYVADGGNARIRRIDPDGTIRTVVGNGSAGSTGDGGSALDATMVSDLGVGRSIAVDVAGRIYFADPYRLRVVGTDGIVMPFAGSGTEGFSGDGGPALDATFGETLGVHVDETGNLYIADVGNQRLRKIDAAGVITTIAGSGGRGYTGDGGPAMSASFADPTTITAGADGSVYTADHHNHAIRRIGPDGVISTVAGTGVQGYSGDCGPGVSAELNQPWGVATRDGVLYVADAFNRRIRMVLP